MNRFAPFIFLLFLPFLSKAQQGYQPRYFKDSLSRIEKIRSVKPVVDKLFKEHAEKNHLPGFVYGIIVDGKLLYTGQLGYTDIEKKTAATTSSAFRIASMSKSFTAMAIVQLRDAGRLDLDDAASTYIPQMKGIKYLTTDAPEITIRHLLNHLGGFPEDNPWGDRQLADKDEELMDLLDGISFSNVPGISYEYSNTGFALLGRIITNVSGKPYQQYINENILIPLGMKNTYWEYKRVPSSELAHGYRWQHGKWEEEALLADGAYGAMGGLITTLEDFSRYMKLHMEAWPARSGEENPVLKRSSLREMHTTGTVSSFNPRYRYPGGRLCATTSLYTYGLGWSMDCEGKTWFGHSGGLPGFGSNWRLYPEYGIGIVCFANRTYAPTSAFNAAVMDTLIRLTGLQPRVIPVSPVLQAKMDQLVKLLPSFDKAEKSGLFAENFFPDNPLNDLKKLSASLFAKAGKIRSVGVMKPENQLRGTFILHGEKGDIHIFFTLSPEPDPLIQELDMWMGNDD